MNADHMGSVHGQEFLFYSFGEDFDYQVRMEFLDFKGKLGEGGFGTVFLAHDSLLKMEVAVKILNFQCNKNQHMITKEIEALGSLKHRHIV